MDYKHRRHIANMSTARRSDPWKPSRPICMGRSRTSPDDPTGVLRAEQAADASRRRKQPKPSLPALPPFKEVP